MAELFLDGIIVMGIVFVWMRRGRLCIAVTGILANRSTWWRRRREIDKGPFQLMESTSLGGGCVDTAKRFGIRTGFRFESLAGPFTPSAIQSSRSEGIRGHVLFALFDSILRRARIPSLGDSEPQD